jgi:hypothetical protein
MEDQEIPNLSASPKTGSQTSYIGTRQTLPDLNNVVNHDRPSDVSRRTAIISITHLFSVLQLEQGGHFILLIGSTVYSKHG